MLYTGLYGNALEQEASPYLQQHAHNPVLWYPWGKEALEKAKKEHKLIFLSIGYSTCHWCHEMEKESFEDETVAALLNAHFISIKVDREAYPQLDQKYQKRFLEHYGRRGGWPLNLFLSPEGELFAMATYIPKEEGYGSKGLLKLLPAYAALQKNQPLFQKRIAEFRASDQNSTPPSADRLRADSLMQKILREMAETYDTTYGGFASRPKYPEASKIALLFTLYRLSGEERALHMASETLKKMALSGLYDQVEGGFFRYTTDRAWQQPHFEKMLYTNAALLPTYTQAYLLTGDPLYRNVVRETIAWVETYFSREGLLFSASDADSDGEEGGYYLYRYEKLKAGLLHRGWNPKEAEETLAAFGIEEDGNVDGELSHLHRVSGTVPKHVRAFKSYLRALRKKRDFPFIDKKSITSWSAMMVSALFHAGKIDAHYSDLAKVHLKALLDHLYIHGRLYHQTIGGRPPKQQALLEDYAFLAEALVSGYASTYDSDYLARAEQFAKEAIGRFYRGGVWYLSCDGIAVEANVDDRHYTAPVSVMLSVLSKLASLTENSLYASVAKKSLKKYRGVLAHSPVEAPKLAEVWLRNAKGNIVVHASKKALLEARKRLDRVRYPFVMAKVQPGQDGYLACGEGCCFAEEKEIEPLLKKIEVYTRNRGRQPWKK